MPLSFEWDSPKARSNLARHGIRFDEASMLFADSRSLTIPDPDHSISEERFITIGATISGKLLVVVHTERGDKYTLYWRQTSQLAGAEIL